MRAACEPQPRNTSWTAWCPRDWRSTCSPNKEEWPSWRYNTTKECSEKRVCHAQIPIIFLSVEVVNNELYLHFSVFSPLYLPPHNSKNHLSKLVISNIPWRMLNLLVPFTSRDADVSGLGCSLGVRTCRHRIPMCSNENCAPRWIRCYCSPGFTLPEVPAKPK